MTRPFALALLLGLAAGATAADPKAGEPRDYDGQVLPAAKLPAGHGLPADAVALVAADGTVHPLAKDDVSRLLFLDPKLHGRPVRLTGQADAATRTLTLTKVRTLVKGVPHTVDYWCENCQFSNPAPGPCLCCGGETAYRERPATK